MLPSLTRNKSIYLHNRILIVVVLSHGRCKVSLDKFLNETCLICLCEFMIFVAAVASIDSLQ